MDPNTHLNLLAESATQYRWAMANIALALLCVVAGAFIYGYVVAGLLIIVVSFALVINADLHEKRGHKYAREAKQKD